MPVNVDVTLKPDPSSNAFQLAVHYAPGRPPQQLLDALARAGWSKTPGGHAPTIRGKTVLLLGRADQPASGGWPDEQGRAYLAQARAVLRRFGYTALTFAA